MDQDLKQQKSGLQTKGNQQPFIPIGLQRPYENAMISSIQNSSINSDFLQQLDCDQRLNQLLIQLKYDKDQSIQFAFMMLDDYKCEKMVVNESLKGEFKKQKHNSQVDWKSFKVGRIEGKLQIFLTIEKECLFGEKVIQAFIG